MKSARSVRNYAAGAVALGCAMAWAGAASAEFSAAEAPLGEPAELAIDLRGRVAARCELVTPPRPSGLRLHVAGVAESDFRIDCNTPFTLKVRSANGGFAGEGGLLSAAMPYELSLRVGADGGQHDLGWCDSGELAAACAWGASAGWSSGDDIAIDQGGKLKLRWREGAPVAGAYGDVITIELEVRS